MEAKEESKHCGPRKKREVQKNKWKEKGKKTHNFTMAHKMSCQF